MHDKHKKPELSEICQIEKDLISALKTTVSHGVFSKEVDGKELGDLVDMVKDMAETKRNCWEACYYETVVEAMKEGEDEEGGRMPRGMEHMYKIMPPHWMNEGPAGYIPSSRVPMNKDWNGLSYDYSNNSGRRMNGDNDDQSQNRNRYRNPYGESYGEYEDARRHYTETRSPEDKRHMNEKAMEHVDNSMMTLREVWRNADPDVKKQVSSAISSLASEFKTV